MGLQRVVLQWEVPADALQEQNLAGDFVEVLTMRQCALAPGRSGSYVEVVDREVFDLVVEATLRSQADGANGNRDDAYTRWQYEDY